MRIARRSVTGSTGRQRCSGPITRDQHGDLDQPDQQPAGGVEGVLDPAAQAHRVDQRLHDRLEQPLLQRGEVVGEPVHRRSSRAQGCAAIQAR